MSDYRCDRCQWCDPGPPGPFGHCRKDTPRIVQGGTVAVWPLVRPEDWCGHFSPKRAEPWTATTLETK